MRHEYLTDVFFEKFHEFLLVVYLAGQMQFVSLLIECQLLPYIEYEIEGVVVVLAFEGVQQKQSASFKAEQVDAMRTEISVYLFIVAQSALVRKIVAQRTHMGTYSCFRIGLCEKLVKGFLNRKEYVQLVLLQIVGQNKFTACARVIEIKNLGDERLIVHLFRKKRVTIVCQNQVDSVVGLSKHFFGFEEMLEVEGEGLCLVDRTLEDRDLIRMNRAIDRKRKSIRTKTDG